MKHGHDDKNRPVAEGRDYLAREPSEERAAEAGAECKKARGRADEPLWEDVVRESVLVGFPRHVGERYHADQSQCEGSGFDAVDCERSRHQQCER